MTFSNLWKQYRTRQWFVKHPLRFNLVADPKVPKGEIHFKSGAGKTIGKIINIKLPPGVV